MERDSEVDKAIKELRAMIAEEPRGTEKLEDMKLMLNALVGPVDDLPRRFYKYYRESTRDVVKLMQNSIPPLQLSPDNRVSTTAGSPRDGQSARGVAVPDGAEVAPTAYRT